MPQSDYLNQRGAIPIPPAQTGEEKAPDMGTAVDSAPAVPIVDVAVEPNPNTSSLFKFFVDGVQRTVPIAQIDLNGVIVPIHITHIAAGAMRRNNRQLRPELIRQAVVLLLPYQALLATNPQVWGQPPSGLSLNSNGNIYGLIRNSSIQTEYYSDTSVQLRQQNQNVPIQAGNLVSTGLVRRSALDRANEIMRILELGVIWELRQLYPDEWILLDGPIAPLTKYSRLVAPELQGLQQLANPSYGFNFLKRVIGSVKELKIIPNSGLDRALQNNLTLNIPVYRFSETVQQTEEIAREVLSAFIWLRRELANEISPIWSNVSGLARFDIPLPAILPDDLQTQNNWTTFEDEQISTMIQGSDTIAYSLRTLLEQIVIERWPVPASTITRVLVETYPVAETEYWLMSSLFDAQELQARGMGLRR